VKPALRTPLLAAVGALFVLVIAPLRLAAMDEGSLRAPPGTAVELGGHVFSTPRDESGTTSFGLESDDGKVQVRAATPEAPEVGAALRVAGRLREPAPWQADALRRRGIEMVLEADRVEPGGEARGGIAGAVDRIRLRADRALGRGMPAREAELARGFVLGEDDRIDGATREDFRRSGLAHLLAVSGQNVLLLCLLAWPLLALLGITLRARLLVLLALIAVYVPVTGAGPSIQRAGVMGAAGLVAALAERPASRWYALGLAAVVTLAINPLAAGDVGWQLSFAAVAGILLWARRVADLLGGGAGRGTPRRAVAEGAAVTVTATVATAPLMAHHFDALSIAALPANLLALPAVAPAMWLGMLAGIAGQFPAIPVEPLNWLNSLCLGFIAQVAHWLAAPSWAQLELTLPGPLHVALAYAALSGLAELGLAAAARRRGLVPSETLRHRHGVPGGRRALALAAAGVLLCGLVLRGGDPEPRDDVMRVVILDVGQGDSILLDPPGGEAILVDTGPPGADVAGDLRDLGVGSLAAVLVTHDQSDHGGGLGRVLGSLDADRLGFGVPTGRLLDVSRAEGVEPLALAEGSALRSGELRVSVLWPPRELAAPPVPSAASQAGRAAADPNALSLVLLAEWRHFSMLLTGDAEAEMAPVDAGPVDLLKVAHHGSEDEGLAGLLDRSAPRLAAISVGDNPYGHPAPETLDELREHGVPAVRTDESGEVVIEADSRGWWLAG
jgi:competence protein ComEC